MKYQFKVGVSLWLGELSRDNNILEALVSSGMEHVELGYSAHCDDPAWTASVREKLDASSVNINRVRAPFSNQVDISRLDDGGQEFALEEIGKSIVMAERLEADMVVIHGSAEPIGDDERAKRIAKCQSSLRILGDQAEAAGMPLALEILPRTCLGNTADELEMLLDGIPPEQIGLCLDTNHPAHHEQLPAIVKQLGQRIITLHVSDYDGIDEKHWMPFVGVIDWAAFANALRNVQYNRSFIYETQPEADTMAEKLGIIQSNFQQILSAAGEKS